MQWFKDTVNFYDDIVASDYGQILNLPTSDEISTAITNLTKMIYDKETGKVFGMNLDDMKNLLPKLQDIVDKIISSLPKWMRPNTIQEQIEDLTKQLEVVKNTKVIGEEGSAFTYDMPLRMDTKAERTQEIVELQAKIDELKAQVFGYNVSSGNLTMQDTQHMRVKTDTLNLAAKDNTGYNMSGMYQNGNPPVVASNINQGDTIVGTSNHINLEKSVNHGDFTSILTFNEGAYLAAGGQGNN